MASKKTTKNTKIAINPKRLRWCLDSYQLDIETLSKELGISKKTLEQAIAAKQVISLTQLKNLSEFFGRDLFFLIETADVLEENIYSPQFRTINNQKKDISRKTKQLIERVEKQRKNFLYLLEDLKEPVSTEWHTYKTKQENISIDSLAEGVRKWLDLDKNSDFTSIRNQLEQRGIMIILTNGYAGKWQISKDEDIAGFSIFHEKLPIIVIKKESGSEGRQTFTLLHELGHLLMHHESRIDVDNNLTNYKGKEKEANAFAGKVLIPDRFLSEIEEDKLIKLDVSKYDNYLALFKRKWGVSNQAIMFRLLQAKLISRNTYIKYYNRKKEQLEENKKSQKSGGTREYRYREPLKIFGESYVRTVFTAFYEKHITLYKTSTYLDNLKTKGIKKLQNEL